MLLALIFVTGSGPPVYTAQNEDQGQVSQYNKLLNANSEPG